MIGPDLELSIRRQCELLRVSRSGLYYKPEPTSGEELALMRRIDELHLKYPFYGSRKLTQALKSEGHEINRKRVQRLMRRMDIAAIAPQPNTSKPAPEHPFSPICCGVSRSRGSIKFGPRTSRTSRSHEASRTWSRSSTGTRGAFCRGGCRRVSTVTSASRRCETRWDDTASPRSSTPTRARSSRPRRSPASSSTATSRSAWTGKGRYIDNIFVERLWRSLKYEEVYLHAYDNIDEARAGIGTYMQFFNDDRFHEALGYQTPAAFYATLTAAA